MALGKAEPKTYQLQRFKIVAQKNYPWARIFDADTGDELHHVRFVSCEIDENGPHVRLDIDAAFEVETDAAEQRYVVRNVDGTVTEWPMPTIAKLNPLKRFME